MGDVETSHPQQWDGYGSPPAVAVSKHDEGPMHYQVQFRYHAEDAWGVFEREVWTLESAKAMRAALRAKMIQARVLRCEVVG